MVDRTVFHEDFLLLHSVKAAFILTMAYDAAVASQATGAHVLVSVTRNPITRDSLQRYKIENIVPLLHSENCYIEQGAMFILALMAGRNAFTKRQVDTICLSARNARKRNPWVTLLGETALAQAGITHKLKFSQELELEFAQKFIAETLDHGDFRVIV